MIKFAKKNNLWYTTGERGDVILESVMFLSEYYEQEYQKEEKNAKKSNNLFKKIASTCYYIYSNRQLKSIAKLIDIDKYFEKNSNVRSGKIVLKNTRITPEDVYENFCINYVKSYNSEIPISMKEIIKKIVYNYPSLSEEQIAMAILYCFKENKAKKIMKKCRG